eukprot:2698116-Heterocapsa_arctica.AAC.1
MKLGAPSRGKNSTGAKRNFRHQLWLPKTRKWEWLIQANQVVEEATEVWSDLWTGSHSRDVMISYDC